MCRNIRSVADRSVGTLLVQRRGAVAVEFAVVAPVLIGVMFAMVALNRAFEAQNLLSTAAREGARFASMDRDGMPETGMTGNEKLSEDIKNFLASNGLDRDSVFVEVKDHEDPSQEFNIDDPANDLKLFEVHVSVDYSAVSFTPVASNSDYTLDAVVVFRNGRATLSD
ncbi:pilus assembly protein [Aeoliella sp. ICT_H6.2]|uniref:Pilus assembly protein n=1 Tax=Aeoliella straminimaris TaxID=2954799 RepID=A0A9X2JFN3_9BACT|nr:TadE/TadG family type IV pilus assembly protein [Aeoliella straminimaris]MCO6042583.1 pilus assembly protein [Aeoliella straminimaris]